MITPLAPRLCRLRCDCATSITYATIEIVSGAASRPFNSEYGIRREQVNANATSKRMRSSAHEHPLV
jgi:hypothetical protein